MRSKLMTLGFLLKILSIYCIGFTNFLCSEDLENSYHKIGKKEGGYYSQCGQDRILFNKFFKKKSRGIFIDIGAHNGISFSNTKFFEEQGWSGICIEPIPEVFEELSSNRKCICIQGCIANYEGVGKFLRVDGEPEMLSGLLDNYDSRHFNRMRNESAARTYGKDPEVINVHCYLLNDILEKHHIFHVDYLSIDTEGNELEILKSIDFDRFLIDVIDVENNFGESATREFLIDKGYIFSSKIDHDDIFIRSGCFLNTKNKDSF